jgi:hypothetical protein
MPRSGWPILNLHRPPFGAVRANPEQRRDYRRIPGVASDRFRGWLASLKQAAHGTVAGERREPAQQAPQSAVVRQAACSEAPKEACRAPVGSATGIVCGRCLREPPPPPHASCSKWHEFALIYVLMLSEEDTPVVMSFRSGAAP